MANTMFPSRHALVQHVVTALPLSPSKADDLFRAFQESGYLARQENTGLTVMPKGMVPNIYLTMAEGTSEGHGQTQVVMLSHPSMPDDQFDEWVEIVRGWAAALPPAGQVATSRMIRELKNVEHGVELSILNEGMPDGLLLSYRRPGDYVIVVDALFGRKRKVYTTKNIG